MKVLIIICFICVCSLSWGTVHESIPSEIAEVYSLSTGTLDRHRDLSKESPKLSLIISNGGGGQAGLIEALSYEYLRSAGPSGQDLAIGWYESNSYYSFDALRRGVVDIAIIYDLELVKGASFVKGVKHAWMDHFNIVGPRSNPAGLDESDTLSSGLDKIMRAPGAFWLTRNDFSAIHRKESRLFLERVNFHRNLYSLAVISLADLLGGAGFQIFDSVIYKADFYREHHLMPLQATQKAAQLGYYTLADRGIFLTLDDSDRDSLKIYMNGMDPRFQPEFLNPADAIISEKSGQNPIAMDFYHWLSSEQSQDVVARFTGKNHRNHEPLFVRVH